MKSLPLSLFALAVTGALACATPQPPPPAATPATPSSFADQVAAGGALYGQHCAECHGASGEGGKAPRVVGLKEGALPLDPPAERKLRKDRFVTVADVAAFTVANMPPKKGGSLPEADYWAILAFDLHANGIDLPSPLTADVAKTLTIPR